MQTGKDFIFIFIIFTVPMASLILYSSNILEPVQKIEAQNSQLKFSFVEKWGSNGSGPSKFVRPHDVNFDSKGFVYVSDRELNNIQKFTHNGTFIKMWGSKGSGDGQFRVPYSIGVDPKDKIYVVDRENHRIQKFDSDGTFLARAGNGKGNADNQLNRPEDIAFSPFGVFVTDTGNDRILKFNSSFILVNKWGSKGTGDGQFSVPQEHIAVDKQDRVYIVDGVSNPRVQIFDTDGHFLGKIGSHCQMSTGEGCVDPDGPGPLELGDGQFSKPEHVSIDSQDKVYVVDRGNKRIQVFALIADDLSK